MGAACVLFVACIATILVLVSRSGPDDVVVDERVRGIAYGLSAVSSGPLPPRAAREGTVAYAAAAATLAERAEAMGVTAPTRAQIDRQVGAWALGCCDGSLATLRARAAKAGATAADLREAARVMGLVWNYTSRLAGEQPEPSPSDVSREMVRHKASYRQGPVMIPVLEVDCPTRACATAAAGLLSRNASAEDIDDALRPTYASVRVNGNSGTGPAAMNYPLWQRLDGRPVGTVTPAEEVASGRWLVARSTGAPRRERPLSDAIVRREVATGIRYARAQALVEAELRDLSGQLGASSGL